MMQSLMTSGKRHGYPWGRLTCVLALAAAGCGSPGERARLVKESQVLRVENETLERGIAQRDGTIALLHKQIRDLQGFGPDRPVDIFAPVKAEIVSRSGGADYDGEPGDDGITVYLRLLDADGDAVKVPGRITVQLLDNTDLSSPRLLGLFQFDSVDRLRKAWYGKFGTQHYSLKCPFPYGVKPPRRVDVKVEFVDYLTGRTLAANKEVTISYAEPN